MPEQDPSKPSKRDKILACALKIIMEKGDSGLTMRKLAACAGMSLSNVQYYFASKDMVLKAMVAVYAETCTRDLEALTRSITADTPEGRARNLILHGLEHGEHITEMCRIFRELWAIATRNRDVHRDLMGYYDNFSTLIADFILGADASPVVRDRVRSLLLPYIEGYSITGPSLPLGKEAVAEMLVDLVMRVASEKPDTL